MAKAVTFWPWWQRFNNLWFETLFFSFISLFPFCYAKRWSVHGTPRPFRCPRLCSIQYKNFLKQKLWLFLTFFLCLHNQLISITFHCHSNIFYYILLYSITFSCNIFYYLFYYILLNGRFFQHFSKVSGNIWVVFLVLNIEKGFFLEVSF